MTRWHNHYIDNCAHFCTATVQDWRRLLEGDAVRVLYEEWERARASQGVKVLAYVVMPNHFHILLWAERGEQVMRFLQRALGEVSKRLEPGGGFWKERPRVLPCFSEKVVRVKVDYLHRNPVRAELVELPEQWQHSSFRQLELGESTGAFLCDDWGGLWA